MTRYLNLSLLTLIKSLITLRVFSALVDTWTAMLLLFAVTVFHPDLAQAQSSKASQAAAQAQVSGQVAGQISAQAQSYADHELIRRLVVFPVQAPADAAEVADEAWWQAREELSTNRRFLVASKQFLVKSDVYQARNKLEPADAIILGKLLDSHALITLELTANRQFIMNVYDGGNGLMLWSKKAALHPSLTIQDQLPKLARRLVDDFMASIPYQGFTIVDSLIGQAVYEEGDVKLAQVDLGIATGAQIGDLVQWIRITATAMAPIFQGGSTTRVFAEGKIVRVEQGLATVEIVRATSLKNIKEYSLVRLPREAERLQAEFAISETPRTTLTAELVSPEKNPMEEVAKERKPLVTALGFISTLAVFLLLAF